MKDEIRQSRAEQHNPRPSLRGKRLRWKRKKHLPSAPESDSHPPSRNIRHFELQNPRSRTRRLSNQLTTFLEEPRRATKAKRKPQQRWPGNQTENQQDAASGEAISGVYSEKGSRGAGVDDAACKYGDAPGLVPAGRYGVVWGAREGERERERDWLIGYSHQWAVRLLAVWRGPDRSGSFSNSREE